MEQQDVQPTQAQSNPNGDEALAPQSQDVLERLQQELTEAQNQVLRTQAELDNFRKRMRREMDEERRFAAAPLLRDLFPALDNLQRAVEAAEKSEGGSGLVQGVKMVVQQIAQALEQHGCRRISAVGETFDPHVHEAISQQPSNDQPAGVILLETQPGYQLHERVLRPSQVIVSSGQVSTKDETSTKDEGRRTKS
jgi:molecular chaperone GrpE